MPDDQHVRYVNLRQRLAVTDTDQNCEITNMFDSDGDETTDIDLAVTAVVKLAEDRWETIMMRDFDDVQSN